MKINFLLDGKREGSGLFLQQDVNKKTIDVWLDKPCKEFVKGTVITIDFNEVFSVQIGNYKFAKVH